MFARRIAVIGVIGLVGWGLCGSIVFVGREIMPIDTALVIHAIGAPIIFGVLSWIYFSRFDFTTPLATAVAFTGIVVGMDVVVVAVLIERSFEMFRSVLGTWLPWALIFVSTWLVGRSRGRAREPATELRETARRQGRRWPRILATVLGSLVALLALPLVVASLVYPVEYVWRIVAWGESNVGTYVDNFPQRPLRASADPFLFATALDERRVSQAFGAALGVDDLDAFLESSMTQAFIVIQNDAILYEGYFNGARRDSMVTSFSTAKSFDSALVGMAIDRGYLPGVDEPITNYLPELLDRDPRFGDITIRDVLMMASGIAYEDDRLLLFNGDGALTTYHPDQRKLALQTLSIAEAPGQHFLYDKYHPQLVGMILERVTGMSVTELTQRWLWDEIGMEFDGAWCLDSEEHAFEKMEAGLNARAIDFAKLGRLFLRNGDWDGRPVISADWVAESTSLDPSTNRADYYPSAFGHEVYDDGRGWYKYFWYGVARADGTHDFAARGDHGQFIYVSPTHHLIVVRNGLEWGIPGIDWYHAFYDAAGRL